jgi:hypothetical protein
MLINQLLGSSMARIIDEVTGGKSFAFNPFSDPSGPGWILGVITDGEPGWNGMPSYVCSSRSQAALQHLADALNTDAGLSADEADRIILQSMRPRSGEANGDAKITGATGSPLSANR